MYFIEIMWKYPDILSTLCLAGTMSATNICRLMDRDYGKDRDIYIMYKEAGYAPSEWSMTEKWREHLSSGPYESAVWLHLANQ